MSRLALYLLGPPRIEREGEEIRIGRTKAVALLAYLAVTNQHHRRDALAALLWPEFDQRGARAELRRALSTLNWALGQAWLTADRESAGLDPDADLWLDVDEFRQRPTACETHDHLVSEVCPECVPALEEAVGLYRDDFMAGFTLPDSLAFDEWQLFQAQALRGELASALERLVRAHVAQGTYEAAIPYARRWVALDPPNELAHRQLMELLARVGQRSAALQQYQFCRQTLARELGVRPSDETRALYERLRSGESLEPEPEAPVAIPHNLPPQPTPFVGREEELAHIAHRLDDADCRLLTLVGPGGIGKTRLALQAAQRIVEAPPDRTRFAHGVFFVPLVAVSAPDALVPTIASALDFSFYKGPDPKQQLLDYLRAKEMLLLLDNFEHLLAPSPLPPSGRDETGGAQLVIELLAAAPRVKILATSREALNVQQEWFHPVEAMRFPADDEIEREEVTEALDAYSAVALFLQCARRARPRFSLAQEGYSVARICQLVEGMPLAIELAAAWLRTLPTARIVNELERGLDILSTALRDLPARHRSMRAVFDHSWNLLSEQERQVFGQLSVFRGSFTRDAAKQVTGATLRELRALVDKSMLSASPRGRYQMHELLQQYAAEKLLESREGWEEAHNRHCEYYTAFLQERGEALKGDRQQAALSELRVDVESARTAWHWAVQREQTERLDRAIDGLCRFFAWQGRCQEGETTCGLAAQKLTATVSGAELRVLAKALAWQGAFCRLLGRTELAIQLLQQSFDLLERPELADHDTRSERAFALLETGRTMEDIDREQARQLCERSLALYRTLHDRWGDANALRALSAVALKLGARGEAKRLGEESLKIRRQLGDHGGIADSIRDLGFQALFEGKPEEGERLIREALAIRREMGGKTGIAEGLQHWGATLFWLGEFAEADSVLADSVAASTELGLHPLLPWAHTMLGLAKAHLGRYEEAHAQTQRGLVLFQEASSRAGTGHALLVLGDVALAKEAYAEAQAWLGESVTIYREIGQRFELCWALAHLGTAARGLGDTRQAGRHCCEALRMAADIGFPLLLEWVMPAVALHLSDQGKHELALELYALAFHYPFVAKSRWFEDVFGRHIADVAATLPPDAVAVTQERGRARDLETTVAELLIELEAEARSG